jgi:hypothetical protein
MLEECRGAGGEQENPLAANVYDFAENRFGHDTAHPVAPDFRRHHHGPKQGVLAIEFETAITLQPPVTFDTEKRAARLTQIIDRPPGSQ